MESGKKLWESKIYPTTTSLSFGSTAEFVAVVGDGGITGFDAKSGRQRFERMFDKTKCSAQGQGPLIFPDSVIACGERLSLSNGSSVGTFQATRAGRLPIPKRASWSLPKVTSVAFCSASMGRSSQM